MKRNISGLSAKERKILGEFVRLELSTISVDDITKKYELTREYANQILSRLHRKGWLQRIKKGIYIFVPLESSSADTILENPWILPMELFNPCYISGWSSAEYWDLTEQIFNTTVVYTVKNIRESTQKIASMDYKIHRITDKAFFGTKKIWRDNKKILIADIHKTIIDILKNPEFGGGGRHVIDIIKNYFKNKDQNIDILYDYAKQLGRGVVFKRLGFISEYYSDISEKWLIKLMGQISKGISDFDPKSPSKGRILSRWNLRINIPLEDIE